MTRGVQVIRLLASVLAALAACFFVVRYDQLSLTRYSFDHPDADMYRRESGEIVLANRPAAGTFISTHREHAYAVPLAGAVLGALILWRRPSFHVLTELVVSAMWLFSLLWPGFVLLMWQVQNIPLFYGMRLRY